MMKEQFPFSQFVGVDVSKAKLDFAFADDSQAFSIENSEEPIVSEIIRRIENPQDTIVVMEATGDYEERLVSLLHRHNVALAVVNPRRIRDFAKGIAEMPRPIPSMRGPSPSMHSASNQKHRSPNRKRTRRSERSSNVASSYSA